MIRRIVLVFGLVISSLAPAIAGQKSHPSATGLQIAPESLGSITLGHKVKLMMQDRTYLEEKVLRASPEEIVMHFQQPVIADTALGVAVS